jgi:hypothetical protein
MNRPLTELLTVNEANHDPHKPEGMSCGRMNEPENGRHMCNAPAHILVT